MLAKLNERINETYITFVGLKASEIIDFLNKSKEDQGWLNSIFDSIDFREVEVNDNRIEITRIAKPTNGLRPYGKISMHLDEQADRGTKLTVTVKPFNDVFPMIVTIGLVLLSLWTLLGIALGGSNAVLIVSLGWAFTVIAMILNFRLVKKKLVGYSEVIVSTLKNASR